MLISYLLLFSTFYISVHIFLSFMISYQLTFLFGHPKLKSSFPRQDAQLLHPQSSPVDFSFPLFPERCIEECIVDVLCSIQYHHTPLGASSSRLSHPCGMWHIAVTSPSPYAYTCLHGHHQGKTTHMVGHSRTEKAS